MRHTTKRSNVDQTELRFPSILTAWAVAFLISACWGIPAQAESLEKGNLGMLPSHHWAIALTDKEIDQYRGGFNGMAFNVFFTGFIEHFRGQQTAGNFSVLPANGNAVNSSPVTAPSFGLQNGQVSLNTTIGNLGGGSGIFQIAQVPGNNNIVNNNLFVKIDVFNGVGNPPIPNLASMLGNNP